MGIVAPSILILEDDAVLRRNIGRLFAARGYDVVETQSVAAFVRAAATRIYSALLMDLWLPDGNGLDAWERVRPSQDGAVAVLMSGQPSPDTEERARRLGCTRFLQKPLDLGSLLAAYPVAR
jgi:DNA-binding NtrC family response regulator